MVKIIGVKKDIKEYCVISVKKGTIRMGCICVVNVARIIRLCLE